jgi:hypothetical protein
MIEPVLQIPSLGRALALGGALLVEGAAAWWAWDDARPVTHSSDWRSSCERTWADAVSRLPAGARIIAGRNEGRKFAQLSVGNPSRLRISAHVMEQPDIRALMPWRPSSSTRPGIDEWATVPGFGGYITIDSSFPTVEATRLEDILRAAVDRCLQSVPAAAPPATLAPAHPFARDEQLGCADGDIDPIGNLPWFLRLQ